MGARLDITALPGTEPWALRQEDAALLSRWLREPITVEYWPRDRIEEAWVRDKGADTRAEERTDLSFRGYSFATKERGNIAVIFVDHLEDYESATFVLLHELSHLHLPSWSPPIQKTMAQVEDEEDRADAVASALMEELFGYPEGVREVIRLQNPGRPLTRCCPMR